MDIKKISILSIILGGVVILSGCGQNQSQSPATINAKPAQNKPASNNQSATPSAQEGVFYTNNEYGFKLKLPDNWEGYTVKITRNTTWDFAKTGETKSIPIKCPDCATIAFYLPYNPSWKLHQAAPTTGDVQVMTLQIKNMDTQNTQCKTYCKNDAGPSCADCDDFLSNSDRFNFNTMFTVEFPDDITPETKIFHNSANEFFKDKLTLVK